MDTTWAIVELMGHNVVAGEVSEETVAGVAMLRVDVPAVGDQPAFTKFFSGSAIYGITPTDEATARVAVERLQAKPVALYILPARQLPEPTEREILEDATCLDHADLIDGDGTYCKKCNAPISYEDADRFGGCCIECMELPF